MKFTTVIIKYKAYYSYISIILLIIFFWIVVPREFHYRTFTICVFILSMIGLKIIGDKTYKLITTGEIKFEEGVVIVYDINNQIIDKIIYEDIENITLRYITFKGEQSGGYFLVLSKGGDNSIKIITTNDKIYKYNIYLDSETDAIRLRMLYRYLKEYNVNVKLKEP